MTRKKRLSGAFEERLLGIMRKQWIWKLVVSAIAAAAVLSVPVSATAHCSCPHRHYNGLIYYIVPIEYYPSVWCDGKGTVWTHKSQETVPVKKSAADRSSARSSERTQEESPATSDK